MAADSADSADYTITVFNHTTEDRTYFVCQTLPTVEAPIPPKIVYTNVYLQGPTIPTTGNSIFRIFKSPYAICGASTLSEGGDTITVQGIDPFPCNLASTNNPGTECFMTAIGSDQTQGAEFLTPAGQLTGPSGSFRIRTDGSFNVSNEG
jgi:hypothetical protein